MNELVEPVLFLLGRYAADGSDLVVEQVGLAAKDVLDRLRRFVVNKVTGLNREGEIIADTIALETAPDGRVARALEVSLRENPSALAALKELLDEYAAATMELPISSDYRVAPAGDYSAVGSVFGSGSISVGGDVVGRDKGRGGQ